MMKKMIVLLVFLFLLVGCGNKENKLDLDMDKVKDLVIDKALEQKVIQEGDYKREDIHPIKVCEAIEFGNEKFDGNYLVYWKTEDDLYKRNFLMENYEVSYGTQRFEDISDRCIDF